MHHKPYHSNVIPPVLRLSIAAGLFIILGSVYIYFYLFWSDIAYWDNEEEHESFYIRYVWAIVLFISVILPFILTVTRIKTKFWVLAWIAGVVVSFTAWLIWYYYI